MGDEAIKCLFSNSPFIERLCVIGLQNLHNPELHAPNLKYLGVMSSQHVATP